MVILLYELQNVEQLLQGSTLVARLFCRFLWRCSAWCYQAVYRAAEQIAIDITNQ